MDRTQGLELDGIKPQRHKGHKDFISLCVLCVFVVSPLPQILWQSRAEQKERNMLHQYRNRLIIIFLLIVVAFIFIFRADISTTSATDKEKRGNQQESKENGKEEDESNFREDVLSYEEWFYKQRAFPLDTIPNGAREKAFKHVREKMRG